MKINFRKAKRAVSPVIATVLLISLVVAASAMVYFIVVPLLKGSASVNFITTQWFDSDGDDVADLVYITLQNTGSASATINNITLTIDNDVLAARTVINNSYLVVEELPLTMDVTARADIAISFDPSGVIAVGDNVFRLMLTYADGTTSVAQENLNSAVRIDPLVMTVFNPVNGSWVKGVIDPQVIVSGGFKPSGVTYDFIDTDQTILLNDQPLAYNIDSAGYTDDTGYAIEFYVNDSLGQSSVIKNTFNIDNNALGVTLSLNGSSLNQGEALEVSWVWDDLDGAQLVNQTLVLSGDEYGAESLFTATTTAVTDYLITSAETATMAEDDFTVTLYVKDEVGNLNSSGKAFSLIDLLDPISYVITPANESVDLGGILRIEVYADDPSGIDTTNFDIYFFSQTSDFYYIYQQSLEGLANYNAAEKKWVLDFNSYILPDDDYMMVTTVYDQSSAINSKTVYIILSIDNDVISVTGAVAIRGFFSRSSLSFFITNLLPDPITITQVYIDWTPDNRADYIHEMRDNTDGQIWLSSASSPYAQESAIPVNGGIGVTLPSNVAHKITILFDYFDRVDFADFEIRFYISEFSSWETIYIYR